ncbi:Glucosidase II beta subunit, N-terminal [Dillenia turbinata]|uniref:Glucosidase 2 subunit beta n=1 Tax=Dillenia turbinata TaxID=194707 RepID=A0AAN8UUY3_9MAGN
MGLALLALVIFGFASPIVRSDSVLGVSPQDEEFYKASSSGSIKCKDGSGKFTRAQLNDDFCDCLDGTDEPGTSACPGGKFYCRNAGHTPLYLFSSRVNDGICDCCDGSDEYNGSIKCPNTCWEAGKVARDKLKKKIATYQEGLNLRKQEIEQAKLAIAKDEAELSKLKSEETILKGRVQQLEERKEQIEKAEEKERLEKEKEDKKRKEDAEKSKAKSEDEKEIHIQDESATGSTQNNLEGSPKDQNLRLKASLHRPWRSKKISLSDKRLTERNTSINPCVVQIPQLIAILMDKDVPVSSSYVLNRGTEVEHDGNFDNEGSLENSIQQHAAVDEKETAGISDTDLHSGSEVTHDQVAKPEKDASENTEALSKEELGRLVASRWTGESSEKSEEDTTAEDGGHDNNEQTPESTHSEEYDAYDLENDDDNQMYDDDDNVDDSMGEDIGDEHHYNDPASSYRSDSESESDLSEIATTSNPSWLEKIQKTVRNILQAVNLFQAPVNISDAAHVRKEYEDTSSKLSKIQSRISSLTRKLDNDFGPVKEFYSFYDRCFESKQNKYVYKICPFKQASQEEGHSKTRLGRWEKFEGSYRTMVFSKGDKCWNGPDRSLKELQQKLDEMNKEQPQSHDEL